MTEPIEFGSNFTALDWAIVAVYLTGTAAIGVFASRYVTNMADYVVAGRSLKSYLGVASMIGTEFGLISVANAAQKGFAKGLSALHLGIAGLVVTLLVGITGVVLVRLRRMGVMTIPEFYERRFSRGVRVFGGSIMVLAGVANIAIFVPASAKFLMGMTGMSSDLHLKVFMTALVVLVFVYTALGGMISVVISDYLQCVVMSFALLFVCGLAVYRLGWGNILDTVASVHGDPGFDPLHAEGIGWAYVLWMAVGAFASCALWQTTVIRACSAVDERTVKRVITGSAVAFMGRMTIPILLGVCALTFIAQDDKLREVFMPGGKLLPASDPRAAELSLMATPTMLAQLLPAGLIGLVAAGMIAAFLSTQDSYMLCWAAVFVQDVVAPCTRQPLSTASRLRLSRLFLLFEAAVTIIFGLWYPLSEDLWDYMVMTGAIYFVGAASVLVLGLYWKRASTVGAYLAIASGFGAFLGLRPVQDALGVQWPSEHVGLWLVVFSFAVMTVGSLAFPDRPAAVAERSAAI